MNTQWNTIKDTKFLRTDIFKESTTFGDIYVSLQYEEPQFYYNGLLRIITTNQDEEGRPIFDVQTIDDSVTDAEAAHLYHAYPTIEDLILNHKFEDGTTFIDFMMTPNEDLEY